MAHMDDLFGCNVFNDAVMQQRLPKDTYKALKRPLTRAAIWIRRLPRWSLMP